MWGGGGGGGVESEKKCYSLQYIVKIELSCFNTNTFECEVITMFFLLCSPVCFCPCVCVCVCVCVCETDRQTDRQTDRDSVRVRACVREGALVLC